MLTRNLRDSFWRQSPALLFQAAFVVPLVGLLLLWSLVRLAPFLTALQLAYGLFLLHKFLHLKASAASRLNFRVDRRQLTACVVDLHLPVNPSLGGVDIA